MLTDLLRRNPADELRSIFDHLERRLSQWARFAGDSALPRMSSGDDLLRLRVPLAGMTRDDVEITSAGRTLRIRASRKDGDADVMMYEQDLILPEYVDPSRATASMKHGLLEIALPYAESVKPHTIEITSEEPKRLKAAS